MLVQACEEVVEEGNDPEGDAAVALISGRIGFASPTDCMSKESFDRLIELCENGLSGRITPIEEKTH